MLIEKMKNFKNSCMRWQKNTAMMTVKIMNLVKIFSTPSFLFYLHYNYLISVCKNSCLTNYFYPAILKRFKNELYDK